MIAAYVWTTPNGFKALIALEELALPYRAHWIDIGKGDQRTPEYIKINPNSKIPASCDPDTNIRVFESGAVLTYLAEKAGKLLPASGPGRYEPFAWMYFNVGGTGPMFGKEKGPMASERYTKEAERLLAVLDARLGEVPYLAGSEFSLADIINYTWANAGRTFLGLDMAPYPHLVRWLDELGKRPAFVKALAMKPPGQT